MKRRPRDYFILGGKALAILAGLPILYLLAALLGSLIPANPGWQQPERGIRIFVETNDVHTWIVVPKVTADMDWRPIAPAAHVRDPAGAGDHVAIGYGNREFYLNTPAWSDLTVERALGAAFGSGPGLVHVYHERDPRPGRHHRPIILTREQYRRLTAFLLASFDRDANGRTIPLIGRGYGPLDVFYEARGGYNLFYTCNEWAGAALRNAGVRVGIWTPFSQSITARF
jgi:uncharacterized protein (TIGR02117 family)